MKIPVTTRRGRGIVFEGRMRSQTDSCDSLFESNEEIWTPKKQFRDLEQITRPR